MKNDKKKSHPILAISVGAMALYGAYSAVSCMKQMCCKKAKMLTKVFKKRETCDKECEDESESDI